jgi:hypothetical protein
MDVKQRGASSLFVFLAKQAQSMKSVRWWGGACSTDGSEEQHMQGCGHKPQAKWRSRRNDNIKTDIQYYRNMCPGIN